MREKLLEDSTFLKCLLQEVFGFLQLLMLIGTSKALRMQLKLLSYCENKKVSVALLVRRLTKHAPNINFKFNCISQPFLPDPIEQLKFI